MTKASDWSVRLMHELQMHGGVGVFITLTYAPEHLPPNGSLKRKHLQLWMKKLRFELAQQGIKVRFFACGEYGDELGRPHYHVILFGYDFPDKKPREKRGTEMAYSSDQLDRSWGMGRTEIGSITQQSCKYVARYALKKQTGQAAHEAYTKFSEITGEIARVDPPFVAMSTHPGIGSSWFDEFAGDAFPSGYVIVDGHRQAVPAYYFKRLKEKAKEDKAAHRDALKVQSNRKASIRKRAADNTDARLLTKAEVNRLRAKRLVRNLDAHGPHQEPDE